MAFSHRAVCLMGLVLFPALFLYRTLPFLFELQSIHQGTNYCAATGSCSPISIQAQTKANLVPPKLPANMFPDECPLAVRNAVGIYENPNTPDTDKFSNAVLLTASNFDFVDVLENWEIFTKSHGLKYAVLAMDDALFEKLGAERAVPSNPAFAITKITVAEGTENKKNYFTLVCNKMRLILEILQKCQVDVIFSDADNVLLQDPFAHDLGKLISATKPYRWDYLYTTNDAWTAKPRSHDCIATSNGFGDREGNTGFEFISATAFWVHDMMQRTILKCALKSNRRHDQTIFWTIMQNRRASDWVHCDQETYRDLDRIDGDAASVTSNERAAGNTTAAASQPPTMCCLDPHYYSVGAIRPEKVEPLVAFHANYVKSEAEKIERLRDWVNGWRLSKKA
jgi:hypothetical protein